MTGRRLATPGSTESTPPFGAPSWVAGISSQIVTRAGHDWAEAGPIPGLDTRFKIHGWCAGAVDAAQKAFIEARLERIDTGRRLRVFHCLLEHPNYRDAM
jgi:hypothetical protein